MSINCDVILQWNATPEQLRALGAALWRWCSRAAGDAAVYQFLNNQALADLLAGEFPPAGPAAHEAGQWGVHFWVPGRSSHDRQATIASLRREIPAGGVEDILVGGTSWNLLAAKEPTCAT